MKNELFGRMQYEPCVLMFGNKYGAINTAVLDYAWSSVVTTNCEMRLAASLRNDNRSVKDVMSLDDMQANLMDSKNLRIIRLFGEVYPKHDLDSLDAEDLIDQAVSKLERISEVIARNGIILIEDFEEKYFSHKEMRKAFRKLFANKKQVYVFNCQNPDQYLEDLKKKGIAVLIKDSLNDFFDEYFNSDLDYEYEPDDFDRSVSIYINAEDSLKPTVIEKKMLIETESFATLLNIGLVNNVKIPEEMYEDYFYMFLKNSVREPQWYGYDYGFNIHRDYEDNLYKRTKKGLENTGKRNNKPVLVIGQTGTGKSISLAALSYRVFREKKYPVIFINNPDVNFSSDLEYKHNNISKTGSTSFNALDALIKNLENLGAKAVLVVWDTSSYSSGREKCYRLYQALLARGRKVFLVSSAYELINHNTLEDLDFDQDSVMNRKFYECKATVEVSDEKEQLRNILINKCKMALGDVDRVLGFYSGTTTNYLAMIYQAFEVIRGDLSQGVFREASANLNELDQILDGESSADIVVNNIFQIALKKIEDDLVTAGIVDEIDDGEQVRKERIEIAKDDFIKCIAVGSQFKLKMPYDFALRILGTYDPNIIKTLTKSTFFVLSQDIHENYEISIRTPLEASMYLQAKGMTVQDEIDCIVKVVDKMNPSGGYGHRQEVRFCEKLIIIVGPNKVENRSKYKYGYEKIISALKRLRVERGIWEPSLISQEITYLREYYGNNEALGISERIKALEEAVAIADKVLNESEYSGINVGIRNVIIVESANSKLLLCQLKESMDSVYYKEIRRDLRSVIRYDRNDYAYVTLLKGSIIEYTNEHDRIKQLELLESMCTVADEIVFENPDIAVSEYFQRKVSEIYTFLDDTSVINRYIDELVANGSSAGLYVLAKKMLKENQVDFRKPIKDAMQLSACEKVYSIFNDEKYRAVIEESESCQYMLLNVIWLMNNKEPIYGQGECWITRMKPDVWKEILKLCNNFIIKFCNDGENQRHLVHNVNYIKALCLGELGDYSSSLSTLKNMKEDSALGLGRVYTKHMLCDEHGKIRKFTGRLGKYDEIQRSGSLYIDEFGNTSIYYFGPHLKTSNFAEGTVFDDIEIGYSNIAPKAFRNIEAGD